MLSRYRSRKLLESEVLKGRTLPFNLLAGYLRFKCFIRIIDSLRVIILSSIFRIRRVLSDIEGRVIFVLYESVKVFIFSSFVKL